MYEIVLFDVDGVMLSEERYFDASALTVYELLFSPRYLGLDPQAVGLPAFSPAPSQAEVRQVRQAIFANDEVLHAIKHRGVNANWDMVYLQTAFQLAQSLKRWITTAGPSTASTALAEYMQHGWTRSAIKHIGAAMSAAGVEVRPLFADFVDAASDCTDKASLFGLMEELLQSACDGDEAVVPFAHERALWTVCQETFQEWYLGDTHVEDTRQPGKRGFLNDEIPIVAPQDLSALFQRLTQTGVQIGIATGRPELETQVPLDALGWLSWFDRNRISTASDVLAAEQTLPDAAPLSKPHPFSYLRSYLQTKDAGAVLQHPLPLPSAEGHKVLVVGDSIADLLAARAAGFDFAAVLTGLEGQAARQAFEARQADYILDDVLAVGNVVAQNSAC